MVWDAGKNIPIYHFNKNEKIANEKILRPSAGRELLKNVNDKALVVRVAGRSERA